MCDVSCRPWCIVTCGNHLDVSSSSHTVTHTSGYVPPSSHGHDFARRARASYVTTVREVDGRACPEQTSSIQTKNSPVCTGIGRLYTSSDVICGVFFWRRSKLTFSTEPLALCFLSLCFWYICSSFPRFWGMLDWCVCGDQEQTWRTCSDVVQKERRRRFRFVRAPVSRRRGLGLLVGINGWVRGRGGVWMTHTVSADTLWTQH